VKKLIVLHIGSDDGFVPGGLLFFESTKNTSNYYCEINNQTFQNWFEEVLPLLKENAVIVIDNTAPYHSVKIENVPTMVWRKEMIVDWLCSKGEVIDPSKMVKAQLMKIVQRLKPSFNTYVIDEITKNHNKTVLRLPPYHSDLNPIEMVWTMVKDCIRENIKIVQTFKPEDVNHLFHQALDRIKKEVWTSCINYVKKKKERMFWNIDFICDEIVDNLTPNPNNVFTIGDCSEISDDDDECDDDL
jgi:transposase